MLGRWLPLVPFAILAAVVWTAADPLAWPVRAFTTFLVGVMPALMLPQLRIARDESFPVPRRAAYVSSMLALLLLAVVGLVAAVTSGFTARIMGLVLIPLPELVAWTALTLGALLGVIVIGRALGTTETHLLRELLPAAAAERRLFVLLSLTAGVAEEIVFRGVLIPALTVTFGSVWYAAVIGSLVFGFLHTYQGLVGTVRAAVLGLVLAASYILSGSLIPAILAHAVLNVLSGIVLADWLLRRQTA